MKVIVFHGLGEENSPRIELEDLVDKLSSVMATTEFVETPVVHVEDEDNTGHLALYTKQGHVYIVLGPADVQKIKEHFRKEEC